jgi:hypothetical protein
MATAITSGTIGGDLYSQSDVIWEDQAGPNNSTVTSAEFLMSQTMGAAQVKIVAGTDGLVTGASNRVTIKVLTAPTSGGTFDEVLVEHLLPVSTTYAAGDEIFSFIPPRESDEIYAKISATVATDNLSAYDLTAYQVGVC